MNSRMCMIFFLLPVIVLFLLCNFSLAQPDVGATRGAAGAESAKTGTVGGRFVVKDGGSMAGGNVVFYSAALGPEPRMTKYIRVPNFTSEILSDGSFWAELPAGKYYWGAVKRMSGKNYGKPQVGDYLFRYRKENSVELKEFTISAGEHIDFGTLEAYTGLKDRDMMLVLGNTTIKGTIFDVNGKPVENGVVFAYTSPQMQGQIPRYVSNYTGTDGKYSLPVAGDDTYFLMARDLLGGGKLEVGEIIGVYGANEPVGVPVKTGETVSGKNITASVVQARGPREANRGIPEEDMPTGYLTGTVALEDGSPVKGAFVYLFGIDREQPAGMQRSGKEKFWWELDQVVGQLDRHGKFDIEVPVGDYNLTIIKRMSGKILEPLQEGDIYYLHRVSSGAKKVVTIKEGEETDLGNLIGYRYTERGIADYPNTVGIASIYGTLTDSKGKPVPNANILVYTEPERLGPPLFSGGPSKADGSYNMMFYTEGTYYLVAKSSKEKTVQDAGVDLRPGIMLGRYGGEEDIQLVIKKGDVKTGINIVLQSVGPPI